jgi:hypothetical protein
MRVTWPFSGISLPGKNFSALAQAATQWGFPRKNFRNHECAGKSCEDITRSFRRASPHRNFILIEARKSAQERHGDGIIRARLHARACAGCAQLDRRSDSHRHGAEPIIVIARLAVKADASYTHPNWDDAAYDSEDKVLIPFDNAGGTSEVSFDVDVFISILVDDEGQPSQIEELQVRNSDFQYVELHPYDPYVYK